MLANTCRTSADTLPRESAQNTCNPEDLQVCFLHLKWIDKPDKNQFNLVGIKTVHHFFKLLQVYKLSELVSEDRLTLPDTDKGTRPILVLAIFWWFS